MALNQNLLKRMSNNQGKHTTTPRIRPDKYHSKVVSVKPAVGYETGTAFEVVYELSNGNSVIGHHEIFLTDSRNPRTAALDDYLVKNDVIFEDWKQLVGLEEELVFEKQIRNGRVFVNVTEREFVRYAPEEPV